MERTERPNGRHDPAAHVATMRQDLLVCKWELCEFGRSAIVNMTNLALLYQGVNLTVIRHR